jgi:sortase A
MKRSIALIFMLALLLGAEAQASAYHFTGGYGDLFYGAPTESGEFSDLPQNFEPDSETDAKQGDAPDAQAALPADDIVIPPPPDVWGGSSDTISHNRFTMPDNLINADGSLGTLRIPAIGLNVTVYEEESLESMSRGVGHFKSTSAWEGNIGVAGHNRGVNTYFGKLKNLAVGAEIIYKTKLGEKRYTVREVLRISETDWSRLQRTDTDQITLITCVENQPGIRLCVIAKP